MRSIDKILVPADFSACSASGLQLAIEMATKLGSEVHVVHVVEPARYVQPGMMVTTAEQKHVPIEDFAREYYGAEMAEFLAKVDAGSVKVSNEVLDGVPHETIERLALEGGYDLIVIGTHGRRGIKHMLIGSVAERVVRRAPCPVLTVRGPTDE